jgi:hypothetical protein
MAAKRGGAGREAAVEVIDLLNWTEGIPDTPHLAFCS